ncbi:aldo/keto reductase [Cryptosporangium phraense]|uniref:Aldo/keto reductase n=1 Tax=Cryptosporangium phraense TaxID=2593070 RepID=A0A545AV89_9ACTN|nr:aldo/keto reductase [Cryptosporangium phraense]TQS45240.1 aldo/keto reductase [Cryptosporangium phraense]
MEMVELGRTGQQVSSLALGAMQMGNATDEPDSIRILDRFTEAGGTFIDTADCYEWWGFRGSRGGQSEEVLGRWMADRGNRDRIFLATKGSGLPTHDDALWAADGTPNWDLARRTFAGAGADTLRKALDGSLRRLGTDHVDLYYVHVDDRSTPLEETLEALDGLVKAGKIRYLGWSNVRTWRLEAIKQLCDRYGWTAPVAVQQQHSYLRPNPSVDNVSIVGNEQLDWLRANPGTALVAYSPILKGIYDNVAKRSQFTDYTGPDTDARLATVDAIAGETGATPNQVVVAFLMAQDSPRVVPLIGPRTPEQLENLLPAADVKLSADQLARLSA